MDLTILKNAKFLLIISFLISANTSNILATSLYTSASATGEGLIGVSEETPIDNPFDNIFHVDIPQELCGNEEVWLTYELEGIADHTAVSRSINDQVAFGGYLVKAQKGWRMQREQVNAKWLRQGDNVLRFTVPESAKHSYRIRNISISIDEQQETAAHGVVLNQPSYGYYEDKAYVKGYVKGNGGLLKIDGQAISTFNGEFEHIICKPQNVKGNTWEVELEVLYQDAVSICQTVVFSQPLNADYQYNRTASGKKAEKFFEAAKAQQINAEGASFNIDASALTASALISITSLRGVDIPPLDAGMVNVTANNAGYRFLPHGSTFQKEARVILPFNEDKIPTGYTEKDIKTYYFDEENHHWVPLPLDSVNSETGEIWSKTTHFTDMINGIIQVPESPEANAYNSTSMKGIKAANPTAGINLMQPPSANNMGGANMGYPINIPAGRNGMQPQLSINYNNGGGNSWMGLGWNLSIPTISIDTRWGAPRYDEILETETYSLNGQQLSPVAHRGTLERRTSEKRFYPRVEGAFQKIIRHGSRPSKYWWEVTDKSGTRYLYGGTSEGGLEENAVLNYAVNADPNDTIPDNISQWNLAEVIDLNGNNVRYYYEKVEDSGIGAGNTGVPGYEIYCKKIVYTGRKSTEGKYSVHFHRDLNGGRRRDITIDARLGFKRVTAGLLEKIEVKYEGNNAAMGEKNIRHYEFKYEYGAFFKKLLTEITEYDAAGKLFTKHELEYYDEVNKEDVFAPLTAPSAWTMPGDGIANEKFKIQSEKEFNNDATALSGTKSKDLNIGLNISVGLGVNVFSKAASAGISGGYSKSKSEGLLTMLDMNGDGLQDKVFNKGGLHYRPNLFGITGKNEFGEIKNISGSGISAFFEEQSKSTSIGAEASFVAFVGYSHSNSTSKTTTYIADVNGDQLPDIVKNGKVYFNHFDLETGNITYLPQSVGTPNVIYSGEAISSDLIDREALEAERQLAMDQNPLLDIVRMWQAPYNGSIKVNAPVRLLESNDPEKGETTPDGVKVWIQLNDNVLWQQEIDGTDFQTKTPVGISNLSVNKGDRLFFRVGSRDNGLYDSVRWKPEIQYLNQPLDAVDANGKPVYRFQAEQDYLLSADQWATPPFAGTLRVTGTLEKPITTDDVTLLILKTVGDELNAAVDTVWEKKYKWNEEIAAFPDTLLSVNDDEHYKFKAVAQTNIDWNAFNWRPQMVYEAANDIDVSKNPIQVAVVPEYSTYVNPLRVAKPFFVALDSAGQLDTLNVKALLGFKSDLSSAPTTNTGDITFSVKKAGILIAKQVLSVEQGKILNDSLLKVPVKHQDELYFEYHTDNFNLANSLHPDSIGNSFTIFDTDTIVNASLHTVIFHSNENDDPREDVIFGTLYRGWGHFGWNGNREWADQKIDRSQLKLSDDVKNQEEIDTQGMGGEDLEGSNDVHNARNDRFLILIASANHQYWTSGDQNAYILPAVISSSRLGDDDLSIVDFNSAKNALATGAMALDKLSKSKADAYTLGASVVISASKSSSSGDSYVLTDYMDMNGDRYPDILSEKVIQYTNAMGGLSNITVPANGYVQKTHATTDGYAASGAFPMTMPKFRNGVKKAEKKVEAGDAASTSGSVSLNIGKTTGQNTSNYTWLDINGDGLPDRVNTSDGMVQLNLGYGFTDPEFWGFGQISEGTSTTETGGAGLGFSKGQNSISAGFSLARSDNSTQEVLMDINGDGLPDKVSKGDPVQVWLNTGNGFAEASEVIKWGNANTVNESATVSESGNVAFTVGFTLLGIKWHVTPSVSGGHTMSREKTRFMDINGDGFPDRLASTKDDNLTVQLSTIGRTNMLKTVTRPLGASFTLSYERTGNTYDQPNSIWTLSGVEMFDGFAGGSIDGVDTMHTAFAYEKGVYDRHEREFYGFEKVKSTTLETDKGNAPYTIVTQTFDNSTYYRKGLLLSETMTDAEGKKYVEKTNTYILKHPVSGNKLADDFAADDEAAFPALNAVEQQFYEGKDNAGKTTSMTYEYSKLGNVIGYTDAGDEGGEDDLTATISYHDYDGPYIKGSPKSIIVDGTDRTYRKREASIDPATGNVIRISQYLEDESVAVHSLEYDEFGNLKKMTRPANHKGERLRMEYIYDTQVNTYVTKVSNSYGYSSEASYDFRFGQVLQSTDLNGNKINYELDDLGRVTKIKGPYEQQGGQYTLQFEYFPEAKMPWALTKHYDPLNKGNHLETATFVDGLGRVLQTKKDVAIYQGEGKPDKEMMVVSGRTSFDAFGRTVAAYYPVQEDKGNPGKTGTFVPQQDNIAPTTTTYDVLNRTLSVTLPDEALTKTEYGFGSDRDGKERFRTRTTDANGISTEQFTDVRGRVTAVKNITSDGNVWTSFSYNAINEQVAAINDMGNATTSEYDWFGRRTQRVHPDAGTTTYSYDLAGNLTELLTANLEENGGPITYAYDHERLTDITYPLNMENDVHYTYGEAGAEHNRAGRIVTLEDATGAQEFFYGPLGEVVKNLRTIVIPKHAEQTYQTEWVYDTWNRLVSMTYPDGEEVTYHYNAGGLLRSMDGKKGNAKYSYVAQLGYDKFEQRVFLEYGNGTKTNYTYEPERRRLQNMTAATAAQRNFMDNTYGYDKVNNILSLKNNAEVPTSNLMGGSSEYTYEYDDLYRLTTAAGKYTGSNEKHRYSLSMSYNSVGGILQKTQLHERSGSDGNNFKEQKKSSYDNIYTYSQEQPHAPVHIGQQSYTYDANGNQTGWTHDVSGQRREILWDEENRIRSISDNGAKYHYVYDASGTRVLKGKSIGQAVYIDGSRKAGSGSMGNYTVYASPYLVLKSGGYTKHYYIEGQRIVSKLGGGMDEPSSAQAGNGSVGYAKQHQDLIDGIVRNLKFLGEDGSILTAGKSGKVPPGQIKGGGAGGDGGEKFQYFYHPDHLGSTSYITDASGEVYQHLEYFAFGGTFVEEHSNTDRTPYLFNGKELDEETGLYYYGARYYDEQTSIFLSVDPLGEKFPGWSPYTYVFNNPVRFVDPTGMEGEDGVTDPPTKEQQAAMVKADTEYGAVSEKYAVRADRIDDGQSTPKSDDTQTGGSSGQVAQSGGDSWHPPMVAEMIGAIEFGFNMAVDGDPNAASSTQGVGVGLSVLTTGLTGYKVYDQYKKGGASNINPVDAVSVSASTVGISTKALSWLGFGGNVTSFTGNLAGHIGIAVTIGQLWYNIYKPMEDLKYAPLYIDNNGTPFYGDPNSPNGSDDW